MFLSVPDFIRKTFWNTLTIVGVRRVCNLVAKFPYSSYCDTVFYFPSALLSEEVSRDNDDEQHKLLVAVTIDDGLCRQENDAASSSLAPQVLDLLRRYDAHATFFLCTNYTCTNEDIRSQAIQLVQEGHEIGNHLEEDIMDYYRYLSGDEFGRVLDETNTLLRQIDNADHGDNIQWFRAPQGVFTHAMRKELIKRRNVRHVIGDCYCDDWALNDAKYIAKTLARQVQDGSIVILHMPEKSLRESSLKALEMFLDRMQHRGIRCVTLGEMRKRRQFPS